MYGLFLEGASLDKKKKVLTDQYPVKILIILSFLPRFLKKIREKCSSRCPSYILIL